MSRRVCVIGTGIAGLSAAYTLSLDDNTHVTLIEREPLLGMDAHSVNVAIVDETLVSVNTNEFRANHFDTQEHDEHYWKKTGVLNGSEEGVWRLDTPPRALSQAYYPTLCALYAHAGIPLEHFDWSFSYSTSGEERPYLRVGSTDFLGYSIPNWKSALSNPGKLVKIVRDMLAFFSNLKVYQDFSNMSLGEYVEFHEYSREFIDQALLPMLSMVCTCSYASVLSYPMSTIAGYLNVNSAHSQSRSKLGSHFVVKQLSAKVDTILLDCSVDEIVRYETESGVTLKSTYAGKQLELHFDHVIVATEASTALSMLNSPSKEERDILSSFQYETSEVIIHTDPELMPPNNSDWAPMNFISDSDSTACMFTMLFNLKGHHLFQTWNPLTDPRPEHLLKRITFNRPIVTKRSAQAVDLLDNIQGNGDVWFIGSYAMDGIPLQENGARSALKITEFLGIQSSWKCLLPTLSDVGTTMHKLYHKYICQDLLLLHSQPNKWINFGLWKQPGQDYDDACKALLQHVGSSGNLNSADRLLDVGFGSGDGFSYWYSHFGVTSLAGVEPVLEQVMSTQHVPGVSVDARHGLATALPFPKSKFTKVFAIDCGYHFESRAKFYKEAYRVLKSGTLVMVDIIFDLSHAIFGTRGFLKKLLSDSFIVSQAIISESEADLQCGLTNSGFVDVTIEDISHLIYCGFATEVGDQLYKKALAGEYACSLRLLRLNSFARMMSFLNRNGIVRYVLVTANKVKKLD